MLTTLDRFRSLTRKYVLFHTAFISLFLLELLSLLIFLPFLAKTFFLAGLIALTVLTAFAYYVLRFYLAAKKPEQFLQIQEQLALMTPSQDSLYSLIEQLDGQEYYTLPPSLKSFDPLMNKFSLWCHHEDVHRMKELLHLFQIHRLIRQIKLQPIDLELHRTLADAYIALYPIYKNPYPQFPFLANTYETDEMRTKFKTYATFAIEELKILIHFLPHDQEALTKLASIYHDLDQKGDEEAIYEFLLEHYPQATPIRFRLGILYFRLGKMAQGLKIYDDLHRMGDPKAEELIQYYDLVHLSYTTSTEPK
jgi:tetratricopeptide (TPR) repeat protein